MANETITIRDSQGGTREVSDTPANRALAEQHGFQIEGPGILSQAFDLAKGISEGGAATRAARTVAEMVGGVDSSPALPNHGGKIVVTDENGGRREVTDNQANRALAEKHGFKIEDATETRAHDIADLPDNQGAEGAGNVLIHKAQSELFFGLPEMAQEASMTPEEKRAWDITKEQHSTASVVGSGAGIAGSMALPVAGEASATAKAETLASRALGKIGIKAESTLGKVGIAAAKQGTSAAVYSAPHAIGQAVFEDPTTAAEGMAAGIGVTAVLGGSGALLGKFMSVVKPLAAAKAAEGLESVAEGRAMKMLGLERATMKRLGGQENTEAIGRTLLDAGVIRSGATREQMLQAVEELGDTSGKKIGSILSELDNRVASEAKEHAATLKARSDEINAPLDMNGNRPPLSFDPYAEVPGPKLAALGFSPKNVISQINEQVIANKIGPKFEAEMRIAKNALKQIYATTEGKNPKVRGDLEEQIAQLVAKGDSQTPISFATAQDLKKMFQPDFQKPKINWTDRDLADQKIYQIISDELTGAAKRVAEASGDTKLLDEYNLARNQYRAVMQTGQMRANLVAKEQGNRFFSPSDWGMMGLGAMVGGGAEGSPEGAVEGAAAGLSASKLSHILGAYAAKRIVESTPFQSTLTTGVDKASKVLRALAAQHVAGKMADLETAINRLAVRAGQTSKNETPVQKHTISPISALMGGTERDGAKALPEFTTRLDALMNDPERLQAHLMSIGNTVADSGDPDAALPMMQIHLNALQYLHDTLPRKRLTPGMFYSPAYKPSKTDIRDFEERCAAAADPFYLTKKIEDGTLSAKHIEAVNRVYPQLSGHIKQRIDSLGYENATSPDPITLPYAVRARLSKLSPNVGAGAAPAPPPVAPASAPPSSAPRAHMGKPSKSIANVATLADRIANKGA